jgi:hypothetical protein
MVMVFNATCSNISVISWRSLLLVEETGIPRENHLPVACHWQTWSHNVVNAKLSETSVVLIKFNDVSAYTVIVSFCRSTWIRYQKCLIRSITNTDPLYNCSKSHNCRINYDIYNMKLHVFLHYFLIYQSKPLFCDKDNCVTISEWSLLTLHWLWNNIAFTDGTWLDNDDTYHTILWPQKYCGRKKTVQ